MIINRYFILRLSAAMMVVLSAACGLEAQSLTPVSPPAGSLSVPRAESPTVPEAVALPTNQPDAALPTDQPGVAPSAAQPDVALSEAQPATRSVAHAASGPAKAVQTLPLGSGDFLHDNVLDVLDVALGIQYIINGGRKTVTDTVGGKMTIPHPAGVFLSQTYGDLSGDGKFTSVDVPLLVDKVLDTSTTDQSDPATPVSPASHRLYLTASPAGSCRFSVASGTTYAEGAAYIVTATPADGYELVGWYAGSTLVGTSPTYTAQMASADVSLVVQCKATGTSSGPGITIGDGGADSGSPVLKPGR